MNRACQFLYRDYLSIHFYTIYQCDARYLLFPSTVLVHNRNHVRELEKINKKIGRQVCSQYNAYNIIRDDGSIIYFSFVNDPFHIYHPRIIVSI